MKASARKRDRQDAEPAHVDGVFVGGELFLKDPATLRVFSAARDSHGRLQHVGTWDAAKQEVVRAAETAAQVPLWVMQ